MSQQLQTAVDSAISWGKEQGLTFSPQKTVAVHFTRKRKINDTPKIKVGDYEVPYADTVKYLGVTVDKKLETGRYI